MRLLSSLLLAALLLPASCKKDDDPPEGNTDAVREPGPLLVGSARVRMPVPVGIGTVGYGGFGFDEEPSPFAEVYPATVRVHNHPDFRAVAVTRGEGFELIFVRSDTVGVFQQFRRAVVLELEERLGRDLDDALVIGATHTHAGPGRLVDGGGVFDLIADKFHPEFYEGMVHAMADAVEQALADAKPGRVGWTRGRADEGISDRRCEDPTPDYVNGSVPVLAIEQEGELKALVATYAIHGTVLNIDDLTLSQDVYGGIEQAVEDRFDHDVMVQVSNAWGADMAPANPASVDRQSGASWHGGYDQMEAVGQVVADGVELAMADIVWEEEPEIFGETHRIPIDREHIGYDDETFENYPYGGVYCSSSADCDTPPEIFPEMDDACIPFNESYPAPNQTVVTVGQLGPMHFVTFPGEPGTVLAEGIMDELTNYSGVEEVMFFGYGQDYLGYAITEEDWWYGGYEASGSIWGPKQGDYLAGEIVTSFAQSFGFVSESTEPDPITPFDDAEYDPYVGPTPTDLGTVVTDVPGSVSGSDAVVSFTVGGADPWYGTPLAFLEKADGTPVLRPNGKPVDSDGQAFWIQLDVDPLYSEGLDVASRAFHWSYHLPMVHSVAGASPQLAPGDYRIRVELPDGQGGTTEVTSGTFTWAG